MFLQPSVFSSETLELAGGPCDPSDDVLAEVISQIKPELYLGKVYSIEELQGFYKKVQEEQSENPEDVLGDCSFEYLVQELRVNYDDLVQVLVTHEDTGFVLWKSLNVLEELNSVASLRKEMKHVQFITDIELDYSPVTAKTILFYASAILRKIITEQKSLLELFSSLDSVTKVDIDTQLHKDLYNFLYWTFAKLNPKDLKLVNNIARNRSSDSSLHDSLLLLIHTLIMFPIIRSPERQHSEQVGFLQQWQAS